MFKNIFSMMFIISGLLANTLSLSDNGNGSWNVNYSTNETIGGFQFNVDGATIDGASGGDAESNGFLLSTNATTVLGFSLSGNTIPEGSGILLQLNLSGSPSGLSAIVVADPSGNAMDFEYDDGSPSDVYGCTDMAACN